jgi:regulator of protease activity HflC (stomatin/prohibitin superfamily)
MVDKAQDPNFMIKLGIKLVIGFVCFLIFVSVFRGFGLTWVTVLGNEGVVRQHLTNGVDSKVLRDGTHFMFPAFQWTGIYKYVIGTQKVTFDSTPSNQKAEYPSIDITVGEGGGQKIKVRCSLNYRVGYDQTEKGLVFSPEKLIALHKSVGKEYEDVILKRTIVEVVNRIARPKNALEIYSGLGYNKFVEEIEDALIRHPLFKEVGIFVENVIVYGVDLDDAYEKEIQNKQLAIQKTLREIEERKAAEEKAKRIFADSQAEVEQRTQLANASKIEAVTAAKGDAEKQILQAEAAKKKTVLEAEAQKEADMIVAQGIIAKGEANAKAKILETQALYDGAPGALRAKVEMSFNNATQLKGMLEGVSVISDKALVSLSSQAQQPKIVVESNS